VKGVLTLLTALVVLAILRVALVVLVVALAILLLVCLVIHPRETLTYLGTLVLIGLASERPVAFIVTAGVVALAVVFAGARRKAGHRLLLTDQREHRPPEPGRPAQDLLG